MLTRHELESAAAGCGFDSLGIAPAQTAPNLTAFLDWLDRGHHAGMQWLARNPVQRATPELLLPGARSVIVLTANYLAPEPPTPEPHLPRGRIARYARGRDYHNWIRKRLKKLEGVLAKAGGTQRSFVDSGPLIERDYAVLAGIGWHGKNTMVLNRQLGNWFFLSEILTTLDFPADSPQANRCGSCTRCLASCPTEAFRAPYDLDARKCISYWTIEHRGPIPEWIRPLMADRIFGCDECLEVCPWNRFARASHATEVAGRASARMPLTRYLALSEDEFLTLFHGTPIRRAKWEGFLRNVCVALGNVGTPDQIPDLSAAASLGNPLITQHAEWAIRRIRSRYDAHAEGPPSRP